MSNAIIKKNGIDYPLGNIPLHYPADRITGLAIDVSSEITLNTTNVIEGAIKAAFNSGENKLTLIATTRIKTISTAPNTEVTIGNITEAEYRPTYAIRIPVYSATGGNDRISMLYVETNGDIKLVNLDSSNTQFYARFNISFLL